VLILPLLDRTVALAWLDEAALLHHVAEAVGHPHDRGRVATRATGLLVVALDGLRQVDVRDEAHIRLVDAHAERDRGDHDHAVLAEEPGLVRRARAASSPAWYGIASRPCARGTRPSARPRSG
jgi:hypothetical protein